MYEIVFTLSLGTWGCCCFFSLSFFALIQEYHLSSMTLKKISSIPSIFSWFFFDHCLLACFILSIISRSLFHPFYFSWRLKTDQEHHQTVLTLSRDPISYIPSSFCLVFTLVQDCIIKLSSR